MAVDLPSDVTRLGRLGLALAGIFGFAGVRPVAAQLSVGAGGGLQQNRPSQVLGRFNTPVQGGMPNRRPRTSRGSGFGGNGLKASGQVGRDFGSRGLSRRPGGGGGAPNIGQDRSPRGGSSRTITLGGGRGRSGFERQGYARAGRTYRSVLDILTERGVRALPPPPGSELSDDRPLFDLPSVSAGKGQQLRDWTTASLRSRILTGQARLRKKDYAGARSSLSIARAIDRDAPEPQIGLIQTALLVGNYHQASQLIRELGRRASEVFTTRFEVETWHESDEAYDGFLRRFREQIVDTTKAGEMVRVLTGYVAWTTGDRARALNQMKQATAEVSQEEAWVNIIQALESPTKAKQPTTPTASVGLPTL